jgi:hypothetical protein
MVNIVQWSTQDDDWASEMIWIIWRRAEYFAITEYAVYVHMLKKQKAEVSPVLT